MHTCTTRMKDDRLLLGVTVQLTGVATMGPRGAMAPSLLSYFSIVSVSWFTFAIVSICCGPLTCLLLATPLVQLTLSF